MCFFRSLSWLAVNRDFWGNPKRSEYTYDGVMPGTQELEQELEAADRDAILRMAQDDQRLRDAIDEP